MYPVYTLAYARRGRSTTAFDEQGDGSGMRKEYDFSEGVRGRARVRPPRQRGAASRIATSRQSDLIDDELTPAQIRERGRRIADLDDVTGYLLVSTDGAAVRAALQRI